ncbi:hypothetical protein RFI_11365 [Reticulomyxa filosa]|uniref:Uncharacterized protein n=1 Tax=Reticulomyxa filosa TaxID=46433 RepID=X6NHH6_RETFI|nr:hypothetical protein RFI_11365 [Reticulomyxa filosa]|eukprot:ETO25775.1 hypothetical protein RFI_11365 [Reticulomyxa filosa]
MGCTNSSTGSNIGQSPDDAGRATDQRLQRDLESEKKKDKSVKKLLLLGPGNSGKSTFFKQLASIHNDGFSDENKTEATKPLYDSVLAQVKALITECRALHYDVSGYSRCQSKTLEAIRFFDDLPRDVEINEEIAKYLKIVWADSAIKEAFKDRTNLSVVDSAPYFFENIDRIAEVGYKPTEKDLLLVRTPTTGVTECAFAYNSNEFRLYDVGGQRSERTKWIHCFDAVLFDTNFSSIVFFFCIIVHPTSHIQITLPTTFPFSLDPSLLFIVIQLRACLSFFKRLRKQTKKVTAVLFVVSLSCYDQRLFEDVSVNAMHEALSLFEETCNSRWFRKTSMILFLNKSDLFGEKIKRRSLKVCFEDYDGPDKNFDAGALFTLL